jgi:flavoprotein
MAWSNVVAKMLVGLAAVLVANRAILEVKRWGKL